MSDLLTQPIEATTSQRWEAVCPLARILPDTGAAALLHGRQVAVVRVGEAEVYALANHDPFSGAMVIARGLVGDRGGIAVIASPLYKQAFALRTGQCLDDPAVALATWPARIVDGMIEIDTTGL